MADIPIPFTNQDVDTDDGVSGILMSMAVTATGFMLLYMSQTLGNTAFQQVNSALGDFLGYNASGSADEVDLL